LRSWMEGSVVLQKMVAALSRPPFASAILGVDTPPLAAEKNGR